MTTTETTPRLATALTVWQAWWEDHDMWDGNEMYLDFDTAKTHAAFSYEADEYPEPEDRDETAWPDFSWEFGYGQWMLLDHGKDTLVRVSRRSVYRPATEREVQQQDALMAAERAARVAYPHLPTREALAAMQPTGRPTDA